MELNNFGYNEHGFKDVELPVGLSKIGTKRLKISLYCPAFNKKSQSESKEVFPTLNISTKVGDSWQNVSLSADDIDLLELRLSRLRQCLLSAGGAYNGKQRETEEAEI
jgi:hypothetical protein